MYVMKSYIVIKRKADQGHKYYIKWRKQKYVLLFFVSLYCPYFSPVVGNSLTLSVLIWLITTTINRVLLYMYFEYCVLFCLPQKCDTVAHFNMQSDTMHNAEINTSIKMPFQVWNFRIFVLFVFFYVGILSVGR